MISARLATGQLSKNGFEMINGPGMLASNVAMGAATLCVALKTKNSNVRQLASSSGFTALLGITEPALYGVLLKFRRVLIAAMAGKSSLWEKASDLIAGR